MNTAIAHFPPHVQPGTAATFNVRYGSELFALGVQVIRARMYLYCRLG